MQCEHAPPGFWRWPGDGPVLIDGIKLESASPTRFFQSVDAYPSEWGTLSWRIQLNKIVTGRAVSPAFRTFYPGVEWNLNHPDYRWFLTAWLKWEGPGPPYRDAHLIGAPHAEGDTALFRIAWMPKPRPLAPPDLRQEPDFDRPLFLRSRVDARDRRRISEALRSQHEPRAKSDAAIILLDDIIDASG
jgi:hypothetical protein